MQSSRNQPITHYYGEGAQFLQRCITSINHKQCCWSKLRHLSPKLTDIIVYKCYSTIKINYHNLIIVSVQCKEISIINKILITRKTNKVLVCDFLFVDMSHGRRNKQSGIMVCSTISSGKQCCSKFLYKEWRQKIKVVKSPLQNHQFYIMIPYLMLHTLYQYKAAEVI